MKQRTAPILAACAALLLCVLQWAQPASAQSEERRAETLRKEPRVQAARLMNELMSGKALVGGPFTLTSAHGERVSLSEFRGSMVLLYFGYTFCPDVCPTDLLAIAHTLKSLGKQGDQVQPLFVTLDPARDTREVLRAYASAFHPRIIGLTGSEDEIRRVATAYKVFFEKVTPPGSKTYFIDHATYTFLLDRNGKYILFFPPGTPPERMVVTVREQLAEK